MNNPKFNDYIDVIYPKELEIKDTKGAPKWPNYLDLHLEFDEGSKVFTRLYDKHHDIDFPLVHVPYLSSNIPESPAYEYFQFRGSSLVSKHGYSSRKQTTFRKFYGRLANLVHTFDTSMLKGLFTNCDI